MSSIAPNGIVRFLTGVPCDQNYENSLDFLTKDAQTSYFLGLTPVHTSNNCTRVTDGVIRVDALVETLLPCNYIMFQNTNFGVSPFKWFYAFITNIEYVNNNMSYVYYQIDDIQTWMFDVTLKQCFVEREHTLTDNLFEHLVDEGIQTSEYVVNNRENKTFSNYSALIFTAKWYEKTELEEETWWVEFTTKPVFQEGNLSGVGILKYDVLVNGNINTQALNDMGDVFDKIIENNQSDSVISIVLCPTSMISESSSAQEIPLNFPARTNLYAGGVKNNKMYNSPFCIYTLRSSDGQKVTLQPEYMNNSNVLMLCDVSPSPSILATVEHYKSTTPNYEYNISFDAFPQCAFAIDGYKAWVASGGLKKQMINSISSLLGHGATIVGGAATANVAGFNAGLIGAGTDIASAITNMGIAKSLPSEVKGNLSSAPLSACNRIQIYTTFESIPPDQAESIDNYFTMFGYKVNKVKTPSRRNRPHFTYLKTKGCHVDGGAPADAIQRIEQIYDNGIRFWVNASEVGDYTLNNSPT